METIPRTGVVHLELHTREMTRACAFYAALLGWRSEAVRVRHGSYQSLELGHGSPGGGVVECRTSRPAWVPYVEVDDVFALTARAQDLGATVLLGPREGPAGWRSVVAEPGSGEVALWQPKPRG
jgi:predicted enzyme related to lactoylglutathione lyase